MQQVVFDRPIADGPTARGFHDHFGVDLPSFPPYCFVDKDRTVGLPPVQLYDMLQDDRETTNVQVDQNLASGTRPGIAQGCVAGVWNGLTINTPS